jgi:hypothetical protein
METSSSQSRQQRQATRSRRVIASAAPARPRVRSRKPPAVPGNRRRPLSAQWKSARPFASLTGSRRVHFDKNKPKEPPKPCLSHSSGRSRSGGPPAVGAVNSPRSRAEGDGASRRRSLEHGLWAMRGDVAQLGEHLLCKQGVGGSSPLISTMHVDNRIGL